ncbi:hypothetical protein [Allokutzneria albata]|uniref:Uncharacterized protein n=1 Tax=Allokutzneria albata TaxID=211114 RepID=A0A1G9U1K3_ALLAB|nr:hypothetical protein [Allokutzneria albata]SDM53849.1 hypothetical protein SAMN04489726_2124 [Allokutzneria albata]
MNTDSDALGRVLRAAVSDVDTPAGFAEAALHRGKRRRKRVRGAMIGSALAVTALVGGLISGVPAWVADSAHITPADDPRLSRPTGGDLAGDAEFLSQSRILWNRELQAQLEFTFTGLSANCWEVFGEPRVYWAGRTGNGPASVVMQPLRATRACDDVVDATSTAVGLVGTDAVDKGVHLLGVVVKGAGHDEDEVFQFGPAGNTVVALQESRARYVSHRADVHKDGKVTRSWKELDYRDGVAVADIEQPAQPSPYLQTDPAFTKRLQADPGATIPPEDRVQPFPTSRSRGMVTRRGTGGSFSHLGWTSVRGDLGGPRLDFAERVRRFTDVLAQRGYSDPAFRGRKLSERAGGGQPGGWHITAALPDGRTAIVGEEPINGAVHIYAVLYRGDVVDQVLYGAPTGGGSALPVQLRLPDGQGWIVARQGGRLQWRSDTGQWNGLPGDAALIPDTATTVQVVAPELATVDVALLK